MWVLVALITVAGATSPIKEKKCPVYSPPFKPVDCGPNAYWESCPPQCPPHQNCSLLWSKFACVPDDDYCCKPTCRCKDGYYRDENFKCVTSQQCQKICNANETYANCDMECPNNYCPVNDNRGILICDPPPDCLAGCVCNLGYRRKSKKDKTCILAEECPPVKCTRPNEVWSRCPSSCLAESCSDVNNQPTTCNDLVHNCQPRCVCAKGYFRNDKDVCVRAKNCPGQPDKPTTIAPCPEVTPKPIPNPSKKCKGPNEKWVKCKKICPPQSCDISYTTYKCPSKQKCVGGCDCIKDYLRLKNGTCVKNDDCPPPMPKNDCGTNETYVECAARCGPYDTCPVDDSRAIVQCSQPNPCPPGCICQRGYKRRSADDDTCILAEDCPPVKCTRPNEVWNSCPSDCRAVYCTEISNQPSVCNTLLKNCQPKCICAEGYYRNENDICVPAPDCGQANCGENKTIVYCTFKCPNNFCPENDDLVKYACKPPRDCPPGCGCKDGYRYKSSQDDTCVLAQDCPPVTCTRPNEEWNSCPPPCYSDAYEDRNKTQSECYEPKGYCDPRCVCKQGYYRNADQTCVPAYKYG